MLVKYKDTIYPSLTLEMLRLMYGAKSIVVDYGKTGIDKIELGGLSIPTDRFGRLSINFNGKQKLYKYNSAIDIYDGNFKSQDIENSIVLIGTSAGGLLDLRALVLFEELLREDSSSKLYTLYVKRCKAYIKNPPEKFDGVFTLTTE